MAPNSTSLWVLPYLPPFSPAGQRRSPRLSHVSHVPRVMDLNPGAGFWRLRALPSRPACCLEGGAMRCLSQWGAGAVSFTPASARQKVFACLKITRFLERRTSSWSRHGRHSLQGTRMRPLISADPSVTFYARAGQDTHDFLPFYLINGTNVHFSAANFFPPIPKIVLIRSKLPRSW